jgi:hypothetical protein
MKIKGKEKCYKEDLSISGMVNERKRGQVAVFIIVALVIVTVILVLFLYPDIKTVVTGTEFSPNSFLKGCVEPEIKSVVNTLSENGGYMNPEGTILYQGIEVKYLCYVNENYKPCVVQQPMIKTHFEQELAQQVKGNAEVCFDNLEREYEDRGYSVLTSKITPLVSIVPGKIRVDFNAPMTITKGDETRNFGKFEVESKSEIYDLLFIAQSIIDFEATYGDSETLSYIQYYPDLSIEKIKLGDGTTIYKLSNVLTKEEFTFASRSIVWPAGFGGVFENE